MPLLAEAVAEHFNDGAERDASRIVEAAHRQIIERIVRLSAHERMAMVRDGLLLVP